MRTILRRAITNSQRRENFLMERRVHLGQIQEAEDQESETKKAQDKEDKIKKATGGQKGWMMTEEGSFELAAPLQNSIEIGETSKKELYVRSVKRYFGNHEEDWQYALQQLFAMYDEAKKQIRLREG